MPTRPPERADDPCGRERLARAVENFQQDIEKEESYHLLFDCFYAQVRRFFARKPGMTAEDCLDLTQDTFLRVYKGLKGFRGDAQFGSWLFRIAHNVWLKRIKPPGAATTAWGEIEGEDTDLPDSGQPDPQDDVIEEERRRILREAIAELPDQMRQCMQLRILADLKQREIAELMGIKTGTVKAHLSQARKKLKTKLEDYFADIDF